MDDVGVDQCIQALEGVGGCVIGELGLEGCRCRTPSDANCWSISDYPFAVGFNLLAS